MKPTLAILILAAAILPAGAQETIQRNSSFGVEETADRLVEAVEGAGATVFARVDHAKGAQSVGAELEDMILVVFGNPAIGTPIIASNPLAGLDLPLRVLIYDSGGQTRIAYDDPQALRERRAIEGAHGALETMAGALEKLTTAASE